jgi:hypothetical protein
LFTLPKSDGDDDSVDFVVKIFHGVANASERLSVTVVVETNGVTTSRVSTTVAAAARLAVGPRSIVADALNLKTLKVKLLQG